MQKESLKRAQKYENELINFLKDIVSIQSTSRNESEVVKRIAEEMEKVGFDEVKIDDFGNVIGRLGNGSRTIAMDGHIDVVDIGNKDLWEFDPFSPFVKNGKLYGRGSADQKGGIASLIYGMKILKELGIPKDITIYITGTVMEEVCDGLCWQYILKNKLITPEMVLLTEPTGLKIHRGQRGRMEIKVTTKGISAHGSAPERGENAIYKMAPILLELKDLNKRLTYDPFLGKGSLTVSQIFFKSPSECSVPDECSITIDRRLTSGEDKELAIKQIEELKSVKESAATIDIYKFSTPTYKGLIYPVEKYFPSWTTPEDHLTVTSAKKTYKALFEEEPTVDKWTFSTNGVSISGIFKIPCIGFGPGYEEQAHAPNEFVPIDHLIKATAFYSIFPYFYLKEEEK